MRLDYRLAQGEHELLFFQEQALKYIGVTFPQSFLQAVDLFLGINSSGEICAGFIVCSFNQSRAIAGIPTGHRLIAPELKEGAVEITGLWMKEKYRGLLHGLNLANFVYEVLKNSAKTFGLLTYTNSNQRLGMLYSLLEGEILYSGETELLEGMSEVDVETVICFEIDRMEETLIRKVQKMGRFLGLPVAA